MMVWLKKCLKMMETDVELAETVHSSLHSCCSEYVLIN